MTHGYRNVFGDERVTVSVFETGNTVLDTIFTDWFFGPSGPAITNAGNIASAEVVGQPTLVLNLTNTGIIAGAEAFGVPTVSVGIELTDAGNITGAEAFGTSGLSVGVSADALASSGVIPAPAVSLSVAASSVVPGEVFGQPEIGATVLANAISSGEAFGEATLVAIVEPAGILSEELFGTPSVFTGYIISPDSIPSGESFGTNVLSVSITDSGEIDSREGFDLPRILPYTLQAFAKDKKGNLLAGAEVYVFRTSDKSLISSATTDSTGFYSVTMLNGNTACFIVIFHGASPRRAGVSMDNIVGALHG